MANTTFTARMDAGLKAEIEKIAQYEDRTISYVATKALQAFVEERQATRELVETGLALIAHDAPTISSQEVHEWLSSKDDTVFPSDKHRK